MSTYILQDAEVKLTGRTALRNTLGKTQQLVEVTPANPDDGNWKKWTMEAALYYVVEPRELT